MPTYGSKNQPLVATTDTFNTPADINSATNWSAGFANLRTVADTSALNALTGADRWTGLTAYKLDSSEFYTYDGSAWMLNAGMGKPPRIDLTKTGTQSSGSNNLTTQTGWTVTANRGGFTEASGVITVPRTGSYDIFGQVNWAANATGSRTAVILWNGTSIAAVSTMANTASSALTNLQVERRSVQLASGATLALAARQVSGSSLNTSGADPAMKFTVVWAGE
jgi:hypothetical protein